MKGRIRGGAVQQGMEIATRGQLGKVAVKVFNASGTPRGISSGPALPIVKIADTDLVDNGGTYRLEGGAAVPMINVVTGRVQGGAPLVVYPVDANGDYDAGF